MTTLDPKRTSAMTAQTLDLAIQSPIAAISLTETQSEGVMLGGRRSLAPHSASPSMHQYNQMMQHNRLDLHHILIYTHPLRTMVQ